MIAISVPSSRPLEARKADVLAKVVSATRDWPRSRAPEPEQSSVQGGASTLRGKRGQSSFALPASRSALQDKSGYGGQVKARTMKTLI